MLLSVLIMIYAWPLLVFFGYWVANKKAPRVQRGFTARTRQRWVTYSPTSPSLSVVLATHQLQEHCPLVITREELGSLTECYALGLRTKEATNDVLYAPADSTLQFIISWAICGFLLGLFLFYFTGNFPSWSWPEPQPSSCTVLQM